MPLRRMRLGRMGAVIAVTSALVAVVMVLVVALVPSAREAVLGQLGSDTEPDGSVSGTGSGLQLGLQSSLASPPASSTRPGAASDPLTVGGAAGGSADATGIVAAYMRALRDADASALAALYAPDERDSAGHAASALVSRLGKVSFGSYQFDPDGARTVRADSRIVYWAYVQSEWTDAGLTSHRTLVVPLRLMEGRWYLSGLDENTDGVEMLPETGLPPRESP